MVSLDAWISPTRLAWIIVEAIEKLDEETVRSNVEANVAYPVELVAERAGLDVETVLSVAVSNAGRRAGIRRAPCRRKSSMGVCLYITDKTRRRINPEFWRKVDRIIEIYRELSFCDIRNVELYGNLCLLSRDEIDRLVEEADKIAREIGIDEKAWSRWFIFKPHYIVTDTGEPYMGGSDSLSWHK